MKNQVGKFTFLFVLMCFLVSTVISQTFLFQTLPEEKTQVGLRYLRPNFDGDFDMTLLSGIYDLSVNIPVSPTINIVGSVPFSTYAVEGEDSENGIGNIYIGLQSRLKSSAQTRSNFAAGLFIPTTDKEKVGLNLLNAFSHAYEVQKYAPEVLTIYANYSLQSTQSSGFIYGLEVGPNVYVPTEGEDSETELFMHYGLKGGFAVSDVAFCAELAGIAIVTEDIEDFGDRFMHTLSFGAQWMGNVVHPGIFYSIYLEDDLNDYLDGVLGIKIDFVAK